MTTKTQSSTNKLIIILLNVNGFSHVIKNGFVVVGSVILPTMKDAIRWKNHLLNIA